VLFEYLLRLDLSRSFLGLFSAYAWVLLLLFRLTAGRVVGVIRREFAAPHYVMVVGTGERALRLAEVLERSVEYGVKLRGFLSDDKESAPAEIALGAVYFFTAVQGTGWFAAHVVSASALSLYLAASIGAKYPTLAGLALCAVIGTRTHLGVAGIFFAMEALRVSRHPGKSGLQAFDWRQALQRLLPVLLLAAFAYAALLWYNWTRFHDAFEVGYRFLQIAWRQRIERWGMFSYHYLARNLGIILTSLPYLGAAPKAAPFQINGHGLALWLTTPLYLWLLWPQRRTQLHAACYATLALTALPSLLYQNSGWLQFGQRFSNDYSPILFLLLALSIQRIGVLFKAAAIWSVVVNLFGALTFQRPLAREYYYVDGTQRVIYEPD